MNRANLRIVVNNERHVPVYKQATGCRQTPVTEPTGQGRVHVEDTLPRWNHPGRL